MVLPFDGPVKNAILPLAVQYASICIVIHTFAVLLALLPAPDKLLPVGVRVLAWTVRQAASVLADVNAVVWVPQSAHVKGSIHHGSLERGASLEEVEAVPVAVGVAVLAPVHVSVGVGAARELVVAQPLPVALAVVRRHRRGVVCNQVLRALAFAVHEDGAKPPLQVQASEPGGRLLLLLKLLRVVVRVARWRDAHLRLHLV
mmetsp:Transcript_5892/g.11237  ORF Transcript_5892/g.11237 Transcript_5892/m.11237 type:complete len:202 (-) Transcript_5892:1545-2150(-)